MREQLNLTEDDGYAALRAHVVERARAARVRHGGIRGQAGVERLLEDREAVRFPTALRFDASPLHSGEFGWARPLGERPADGFELVIHPAFAGRWDVLPLLVAYHLVSIDYLDVATHEEAELFGSELLGLGRDEYYERICELADSLPRAPEACSSAAPTVVVGAAEQGGGGCSGSCACGGA